MGKPHNASFGPESRHGIDIYPATARPRGGLAAGPAPVLVFVYGGGWTEGRRSLYGFLGRAFAARGFCVAIPDYRLYPETRYPSFVEDAALALRWVTDHIAEFGGDPARLHLMGHSAGAHTGALLCLDDQHLAAVGLSPSHITSFTGVAGPYSFNPLESAGVRPVFEHLEDINVARPIKRAHGNAPPMLLLHSTRDRTVGVHNSEFLYAAITEAGGAVRRITYPLIGHIAIIASIAAPLRFLAPVLRDSVAFMREVDEASDRQ